MSAPPQYRDEPSPPPSGVKKSYGAAPTDVEAGPLLAQSSSSNAWMNQPGEDDLPDDYKVGVAVIDCDAAIRQQFVRKVYSILGIQILASAVVAVGMSTPTVANFMQEHGWIIWIPMLGSFVTMGGVYWKRHQHPANLILLGLFTIFEAMLVGTITSFYESKIALFITLGIFVGLTLFTFQTKYDFSSFGPFLFAGIMGLLTTSLVQIFLPFNSTVDLAIAGFSVILFSGFILYDTQQIQKRMSPDDHIVAALNLYVDVIQLFLSVLRVLNNSENR